MIRTVLSVGQQSNYNGLTRKGTDTVRRACSRILNGSNEEGVVRDSSSRIQSDGNGNDFRRENVPMLQQHRPA